jgi:hypothetical protein
VRAGCWDRPAVGVLWGLAGLLVLAISVKGRRWASADDSLLAWSEGKPFPGVIDAGAIVDDFSGLTVEVSGREAWVFQACASGGIDISDIKETSIFWTINAQGHHARRTRCKLPRSLPGTLRARWPVPFVYAERVSTTDEQDGSSQKGIGSAPMTRDRAGENEAAGRGSTHASYPLSSRL